MFNVIVVAFSTSFVVTLIYNKMIMHGFGKFLEKWYGEQEEFAKKMYGDMNEVVKEIRKKAGVTRKWKKVHLII